MTSMDPNTAPRNQEENSSEEGLPSPEPHTDSRNHEEKSSEDALHSPNPCWIYKGTYAKTEIIVKFSSCVLGYVTI